MRVISRSTLSAFWSNHTNSKSALEAWFWEARHATWQSSSDIKAAYKTASFLIDNRVVFNIKGNDYRLIVSVAYQFGAVYIKFIGTHAQYDAINAETIELE